MRNIESPAKKIIVITVGILIVFSLFSSRILRGEFRKEGDSKRLVIAACPTFHYMLDVLQEKGYEVIRTASTKENIDLMEKGITDLFISGRDLLGGEPFYENLLIGPGYAVLSEKEKVILKEEVDGIMFFTDGNRKEVLESFPFLNIEMVKEVESIEDYLSEGIVITSPSNEKIGELIHLVDYDGKRVRLSRAPRLYHRERVDEEDIIIITGLIEEDQ